MMPENKNSRWEKLGGFWKRVSPTGKAYLGGEIEIAGVKTFISCWLNDKGDNDKRPDYVIYKSDRDSVIMPPNQYPLDRENTTG